MGGGGGCVCVCVCVCCSTFGLQRGYDAVDQEGQACRWHSIRRIARGAHEGLEGVVDRVG